MQKILSTYKGSFYTKMCPEFLIFMQNAGTKMNFYIKMFLYRKIKFLLNMRSQRLTFYTKMWPEKLIFYKNIWPQKCSHKY